MGLALAAWRPPLHDSCVQELSAGTLLGHYRVTRRLGRGGMGVVYEAEDLKLGRSVAIKMLPEATRPDPAALERFWREARAASSLNHPGICTIHELNESGDQPFIVMELLEGQSLDKLDYRRAVPYPRLLDLGVQVADALDAAHKRGILHRDIKPVISSCRRLGKRKFWTSASPSSRMWTRILPARAETTVTRPRWWGRFRNSH
jgi:serine/threonine protein kinase